MGMYSAHYQQHWSKTKIELGQRRIKLSFFKGYHADMNSLQPYDFTNLWGVLQGMFGQYTVQIDYRLAKRHNVQAYLSGEMPVPHDLIVKLVSLKNAADDWVKTLQEWALSQPNQSKVLISYQFNKVFQAYHRVAFETFCESCDLYNHILRMTQQALQKKGYTCTIIPFRSQTAIDAFHELHDNSDKICLPETLQVRREIAMLESVLPKRAFIEQTLPADARKIFHVRQQAWLASNGIDPNTANQNEIAPNLSAKQI